MNSYTHLHTALCYAQAREPPTEDQVKSPWQFIHQLMDPPSSPPLYTHGQVTQQKFCLMLSVYFLPFLNCKWVIYGNAPGNIFCSAIRAGSDSYTSNTVRMNYLIYSEPKQTAWVSALIAKHQWFGLVGMYQKTSPLQSLAKSVTHSPMSQTLPLNSVRGSFIMDVNR